MKKTSLFLVMVLAGLAALHAQALQTEGDWQFRVTNNTVTIMRYLGSAQTVTIPARIQNAPVIELANNAFKDSTAVTTVTIPEGVTKIGSFVFHTCTGLTRITIPNTVTEIGASAFYRCSALTEVTVPNSVTRLGGEAFRDCTSLRTVTFMRTATKTGTTFDGTAMGGNQFLNTHANLQIRVPSAAVNFYKQAGNMASYRDRVVGF